MLKRKAKDPEPAVCRAGSEHGALCSPAGDKPWEQWVARQVGVCGWLRSPGTPAVLKPKLTLPLQLLDGSTAQLDVVPPCGAHCVVQDTWTQPDGDLIQCLCSIPLAQAGCPVISLGFIIRYPLALLEVMWAGPPK